MKTMRPKHKKSYKNPREITQVITRNWLESIFVRSTAYAVEKLVVVTIVLRECVCNSSLCSLHTRLNPTTCMCRSFL